MYKNPLEYLAEAYEDGVKEGDTKGYADKFMKASTLFFDSLKEGGFTVKDVTYGDGYFIFGWGTNSTVQFHIEECPEWLFGIWWDMPEESDEDKKLTSKIKKLFRKAKKCVDDREYISGTFFGQYEAEIDKFKPSYSEIRESLSTSLDGNKYSSSNWGLFRALKFVRDEKELAFCREIHYWDYNTEYHTREEAIEVYNKYKVDKEIVKGLKEDAKQELFKLYKDKIGGYLPELKIHDMGKGWTPRYDLIIPMYSLHYDIESGVYDWYDLPEGDVIREVFDKDKKDVKELTEEINNRYSELFSQHDSYYMCQIRPTVHVIDVTKEKYDKIEDCYKG